MPAEYMDILLKVNGCLITGYMQGTYGCKVKICTSVKVDLGDIYITTITLLAHLATYHFVVIY